MARVIPGVQVSVVKEVVPQQLAPSGVLGIAGLTENDISTVERAASWSRFVELFGPGSAYSIPEARQALDNGVFELVISPIKSESAKNASCTLLDFAEKKQFKITARSKGVWADDLQVKLVGTKDVNGKTTGFDLHIQNAVGDDLESYRNLSATLDNQRYFPDVLQRSSSRVICKSSLKLNLELGEHELLSGQKLVLIKSNQEVSLLTIKSKSNSEKFLVKVLKGTQKGNKIIVSRKLTDGNEKILENDNMVFPGDESLLFRKLDDLKDHSENKLFNLTIKTQNWPVDGEFAFEKGADAKDSEYESAIRKLENEPDVDMVLAAVQDFQSMDNVIKIYSAIISHCTKMSGDCKGRIGFSQVPPTQKQKEHLNMAANLVSDRFVLVAPNGVVGAVAGMVGNLDYFRSPTFKSISGLGKLKTALTIEDQRTLLMGNVVPVVQERGRGIILLRGLTTDGDQISVRRVADRAVRGVKMLGNLFIGKLNNSDGRGALKQKLIEFLIQMEKEGAIVPSTYGTDPAFKVDVYSSQEDFAMGIVRVDLAVRPVRAIDYIYATILVQV